MPATVMMAKRQCTLLATHNPHKYFKNKTWFSCSGLPCNHQERCCTKHGFHLDPHRGCFLR